MEPDRERLADHTRESINLDSRLLEKLDAAFACAADRTDEAMRATGPESDIGERFEAGLRALLESAAGQADLTRLALVEAPGLGSKALERKDAGLQRFVDLLNRELARDHEGQAPSLVSEMIVGGVYEVVQRTARTGDVASLPDLTDRLHEFWLPALRGHQ